MTLIRRCMFICIAASWPAAAADAPDIRALMTTEEFDAAGLDQLNAEQLAALNAWLLRYTAHDAPTVRQTNAEVKREIRKPPPAEIIRDRIVGEFNGWDGKTLFPLKNGQIWQQRMDDTYRFKDFEPEVEIYRSLFGLYRMRIVATGKSVPVSRVK
jgi:hypothetical protein